MNFKTIAYLEYGNEMQRCAFKAVKDLNVMKEMAPYKPVLCGTIPISIDIEGSDLDVIMEVYDFGQFTNDVQTLYSHLEGFDVMEYTLLGVPSVMANFRYGGFEFELFGQPKPVERQNAYRHMIIEHHLLTTNPQLRPDIIRLKERGLKTEPAFAHVLGLAGDPYEELLSYGVKLGIIDDEG